jgi:hypothetical protein
MQYSRSNKFGIILDEAIGGVMRIFNVPDFTTGERRGTIKWSVSRRIKSLINKVNSQGLAYFNSIPFIY